MFSESIPDFILFIGRFHPLVLHMPIGLLLLAFGLDLFTRFAGRDELRPSVNLILLLGLVSTVVASICGFFLSLEGGYDESTVFWHQWLGVAVILFSAAAFITRVKANDERKSIRGRIYNLSLILMVISLMAGSHKGGELTHGSTFLTEYMPNPLRALMGLEPKKGSKKKAITDINEALVYEDIIAPILDSRCMSCHGPEKKKGELMLNTPEHILAGGERGDAVVPGKKNESELYLLINLPHDDEEVMPPKGKRALTEEQIAIIGWWIDSGADFDKQVGELERDAEISTLLKVSLESRLKAAEVVESATPVQYDNAKLRELEELGFKIAPMASGHRFLDVYYFSSDNRPLDIQSLEKLLYLKNDIAVLDLGDCGIDDGMLTTIGRFANLKRLKLDNNKGITDAGVSALEGLSNLESLNLYNTSITDFSLNSIKKIPSLKKVYFWQTGVSSEAVAKITNDRPALRVELGDEVLIKQLNN